MKRGESLFTKFPNWEVGDDNIINKKIISNSNKRYILSIILAGITIVIYIVFCYMIDCKIKCDTRIK